MMAFSDRLYRLVEPFSIRPVSGLSCVQEAAAEIDSRWPDVIPAVSDLQAETTMRRVVESHKVRRWDGVKRGEVLVAARLAFASPFCAEPDLDPFRSFLIEEFRLTDWAGLRRVVFDIYLASYMPGAPHTRALARAISDCKDGLPHYQQDLLNRLPALLKPRRAPQLIADLLIETPSPAQELERLGVRERYDSGLTFHVFVALVGRFRPFLAREDSYQLNRFFEWLNPKGASARKYGAGIAIDAVLEPWVSCNPAPEYQQMLIHRLVATYGDPRVSTATAWAESSEESLYLIRRWLTGETMSIFLNAISRTNGENMWLNRRDFWMDLYENDRIDEAWVAFSLDAYSEAQRMATNQDERDFFRSFGKQTARGGRGGTSLLIMRIGRRIVVEGTHSYKVHIFEPDNARIPSLYQGTYDCESIRMTSDYEKAHHRGSWQHWVRQMAL